jgi:hypothetical protein
VNIWTDPANEINLPNNDFTVRWSSENANSCSVSGPGLSSSATSGEQSFTDKARDTYNFSVTCQNESGTASANTSISIKEIPFCLFTANPSRIVPPQKSTLTWSCNNVSGGCKLGNTSVGDAGSEDVAPQKTTTYVLDCLGADGNSHNEATVSIDFIPWFREIIPIW